LRRWGKVVDQEGITSDDRVEEHAMQKQAVDLVGAYTKESRERFAVIVPGNTAMAMSQAILWMVQ
jgi:hypothetical protein